jgi:hypothetical protein
MCDLAVVKSPYLAIDLCAKLGHEHSTGMQTLILADLLTESGSVAIGMRVFVGISAISTCAAYFFSRQNAGRLVGSGEPGSDYT